MLTETRDIWKIVSKGIDIERIKHLPVQDKFDVVEFIKYLRDQAQFVKVHGLSKLPEYPHYAKGLTNQLLGALVAREVPADEIRAIVWNYLDNFKNSDTMYAKFSILAMGMLLIRKGVGPEDLFHILLATLGEEFLSQNLKLIGYQKALSSEAVFENVIRYKEIEMRFRPVKYELLGMNILAREEGFEKLEHYIMHNTDDQVMKLYYPMIAGIHSDLRREMVKMLIDTEDEYNKMIITGLISIFLDRSIMLSHYMMNSVIGKYDHYDQRPDTVEAEARENYKKIKERMAVTQ